MSASKIKHNNIQSRELETTLTHKRAGLRKENGKIVSAFDAHLDANLNPQSNQRMSHTLQKYSLAVQSINIEFITLFQSIISETPQAIALLQTMGEDQNKQPGLKMSKEEKYKNECLKLLRKNLLEVKKIEHFRLMFENWGKIMEFLKSKQPNSSQQQLESMAQKLVQEYEQISIRLQKVEKEFQRALSKRMSNLESLQEQQFQLSSQEKSYKKYQRRLKKQMSKQEQYEEKCSAYEQQLEDIQRQIFNMEAINNNIQLKIIDQQAKAQAKKEEKGKRKQSLKKPKSKSSNKITTWQDKIENICYDRSQGDQQKAKHWHRERNC